VTHCKHVVVGSHSPAIQQSTDFSLPRPPAHHQAIISIAMTLHRLVALCSVFFSCLVGVQSFSILEASTQLRPSALVSNNNDNNRKRRVAVLDDDALSRTTVQASADGSSGGRLPTVLAQIVNERAEFQINLGRAMDTLQSDMPYILKRPLGSY
jgi:hypothetical protein